METNPKRAHSYDTIKPHITLTQLTVHIRTSHNVMFVYLFVCVKQEPSHSHVATVSKLMNPKSTLSRNF